MSFPLAYSALRWQNPKLEQITCAAPRSRLGRLGSASVARLARLCASCYARFAMLLAYRSLPFVAPNVTLDVTHPTHEINKRRIEFASDLEVPTFMTKGPGRLDRETTDLDLDRMAAVYDDLAAYGEPLGVTVTFHPHTGHVVDSADEWKRFMTRSFTAVASVSICLMPSTGVAIPFRRSMTIAIVSPTSTFTIIKMAAMSNLVRGLCATIPPSSRHWRILATAIG